ncbi:MAG: aminomethyl-transferring glycine dehydrogenase subunit GcvPB [Spirochaetaceae bacterium]|jgi:glycine dehydrogenase subunit 2|nr:aminomethyl-transferring glycine dehydrogenase subunit GcvPB [Spirochaetaceae bacterium]
MKLIFEKSREGRACSILPKCDVPKVPIAQSIARQKKAALPELDENELSRHYWALAKRSYGVNDGFYPLGSCTMKYNPKINEEIASLTGFTGIHPLQNEATVKGCLEALKIAREYLCEISGMDAMSFQPAAGAHGEFLGLLLIKAYHQKRGDTARTKIIVPDSAHGTNPASAAMAGFQVINIASGADGCVDLNVLQAAVGNDTAGLMLTNPNTVGIVDRNILKITDIVHKAGGLNYYDGANLNAIAGIVRPGDMGFDVVHLNLHKTFATPHGAGGPGAGAVGVKKILEPFLPLEGLGLEGDPSLRPDSIGRIRVFYGNFLVVLKSLTYLLMLGRENIAGISKNAVLNANYMMERLKTKYKIAYDTTCMHEFVLDIGPLKHDKGVSAMDIAKGLQDEGFHPPTMYFPLIVHEALMVEPTETESRETLDAVIETFFRLYDKAQTSPDALRAAPVTTVIGRPDDVKAAREPKLRY